MINNNTAIVVFRLAGFEQASCLATLVYEYIKPYFPGPYGSTKEVLKLFEIEIDFSTPSKRQLFHEQVEILVIQLKQ